MYVCVCVYEVFSLGVGICEWVLCESDSLSRKAVDALFVCFDLSQGTIWMVLLGAIISHCLCVVAIANTTALGDLLFCG